MIKIRYLDALAKNIETFCKDPIQRDAFIDAFLSRHTIGFALHPVSERPHNEIYSNWITNNAGVLCINVYFEKIIQDINEVGKNLSAACSGADSGPLSVAMRKNINDSKKAALTHLAKIYELTGIEFEFEVDWADVAGKTSSNIYKDRIGDVIHDWYLKGLAKQLEKFVKDPIYKDAFAEICGERKALAFMLRDEKRTQYDKHWLSFDNGVLVINVPKSEYSSSTDSVGEDLAQALSSLGGLSLQARKNINDAGKERDANLAIIEKATGITFDVEADWELLNKQHSAYKDRVGDMVYKWYLGGLAKNIAKFCEHPIKKEAFVDSFTTRRTITFKVHDETPATHRHDDMWCTNEAGVLTINFEKMKATSNCDKCGADLVSCCSEGDLTLAARLDIFDTMPARAKIMEQVLAATGVDYEVEVDWKNWCDASNHLYPDRPGGCVNAYLTAFAKNVVELCKDEMSKEAFVDATPAKQIYFRIVSQDELGGSHVNCTCTFSEEGILHISTSKDKCYLNTSSCGEDIIKRL